MATNDFIGFASAGSANIMSQADYSAAAEQIDGVQPGPASSALANKIWRQGANMAAAMGRLIAAYNYNAYDNGDLGALQTAMTSALKALVIDTMESGTFTPILKGGTTDGAFSGGLSGSYIKIGKLVFIFISVSQSECTSVPAGNVIIAGLPYVSSVRANMLSINQASGYSIAQNTAQGTLLQMNTSTGNWDYLKFTTTSTPGSYLLCNVGTKLSFYVSGMYETN